MCEEKILNDYSEYSYLPPEEYKMIKNEEAYERWLEHKKLLRVHEQLQKDYIMNHFEREKDTIEEKERQNFSEWLANKKERELRTKRKIQEQRKREKEIREQIEEKQRLAKNKYKLWLQKKEEEILVRKMKEVVTKSKEEDMKKKRSEDNKTAYKNWLENSKYRPRPVPSNQGIDSLKTSATVSYVNPNPWVPNIKKPDK